MYLFKITYFFEIESNYFNLFSCLETKHTHTVFLTKYHSALNRISPLWILFCKSNFTECIYTWSCSTNMFMFKPLLLAGEQHCIFIVNSWKPWQLQVD